MRALVTGASGFIGSFLVDYLNKNFFQVRALVRNKGRPNSWLSGLDYEAFEGDVTDPESVVEAVRNVDYVFHLAGLTKSLQKDDLERINCIGTQNLLQAISKNNPNIQRFIFVSSLAAAGPSRNGQPLTEEDLPQPISDYGKSKLCAEHIVLEFKDKIPISIVRPPSVYGPREVDVYGLFKYTKLGWGPDLTGGPRYISLIHVKDFLEGLFLTATSDTAIGKTYYLSNDEYYNWDSLWQLAGKIMGKKAVQIKFPLPVALVMSSIFQVIGKVLSRPILFNIDKYRELKQTHWICDNSKVKKELGFQVKVPLEEGFRETCKWYQENGWL